MTKLRKYPQFLMGCLLLTFSHPVLAEKDDYFDLSLEELMNVEVTSASKKTQQLSDTPAATFVITKEDIKRSGATAIPELLRMVPGMDVSRIDTAKWAVSARGFNGRFANKLLVMIDGRTIYTQQFSGVYWENQDLMLEDIERIEVVRGPGAALWGANAVNGVVNIITKHSEDTKGGLVTVGGGTVEQGFGSARYGAKLGKDTTARVYFKGLNRDSYELLSGGDAKDHFNNLQGGMRIDSMLTPQDALTVSADGYTSEERQNLEFAANNPPAFNRFLLDTTQVTGGNLRGRLKHTTSSVSNYTFQFYYDIYDRKEPFDFELRQTLDLDFQHNFKPNDWNEIVWGLSYRYMDSEHTFPLPETFSLNPSNPTNNYFSAFVRDELSVIDNELWLTIGSKFEHNDFSGFEIQPTARLLWAPNDKHRFWGAISRAVRTPSVIDDSLSLITGFLPPRSPQNRLDIPVALVLTGSHNFRAEELLAYELGYRFTVDKSLSVDVTGFYNDYDSLRLFYLGTPSFNGAYIRQPVIVNNAGNGQNYGFETALVWQMFDWWRWDLMYSYLKTDLKSNELFQEAESPQHRASIRAIMTPWPDINLDLWLRYADKSTFFTVSQPFTVDSYVTMDARLAWKPIKNLELSIVGQNLLDSHHLEAIGEAFTRPTEIPRSFYGKVAFEF